MNRLGHLIWIAVATAVGLAASFVFGDWLSLPVDLYYLIYFSMVGALFLVYVRRTRLDVLAWIKRRARIGVLLGIVFGLSMVQFVWSQPATERLSGDLLAWAIFWRGIVYGAVDGLLLFTLPWLITWRAFGGEQRGLPGKLGAALAAWCFILLATTGYHLGYRDFRSEKILQPNIGSAISALPTLISANPLASVLTHVMVHVAAVVHAPQGALFLPPHREKTEISDQHESHWRDEQAARR